MSDAEAVSVDIDIQDGRTTITVSGDRDAAVVVRSASGERIYLPPEDFERPPRDGSAYGAADSPYQSADSPYQSADSPYQSADSDSPYQTAGPKRSPGLEPTAEGFRIVHPEAVTDFRILR
jgi:hypothetical protein